MASSLNEVSPNLGHEYELPVFVLGYKMTPLTDGGILFVTDFTTIRDDVTRHGDKLPILHITKTGDLDSKQIFCVRFSEENSKEIKSLGKSNSVYSKANIVTIRFKRHSDEFELIRTSGKALKDIHDRTKTWTTPAFKGLLYRFFDTVKSDIQNNAPTKMAIYNSENAETKKRKLTELSQLNFFKSARPNVASLVFRNRPIEDDEDDEEEEEEEEDEEEEARESRIEGSKIVSHTESSVSEPQVLNTSNVSDEWKESKSYGSQVITSNSDKSIVEVPRLDVPRLDGFNDFLVSKVTIGQLKILPDSQAEISKAKEYSLKGYLRMAPPLTDFVIKPYKRTLKISPFKVYLFEQIKRHNTTFIELEFITEEEICAFLGLAEIEDAYTNYSVLQTQLNRVLNMNEKIVIPLTRKICNMATKDLQRLYWTCTRSINDLI